MQKGQIIEQEATDYFINNNLIFNNLDVIILGILILMLLNTALLIYLVRRKKTANL
jgi:hypothetical protein